MKRLGPGTAFLLVVFFVLGALLVAYAWWTSPLLTAERALAEGRQQAAMDGFVAAERRFARFGATRVLFAREHATAVYNQLALLYRTGDYDAVIERASTAPIGAAPRFWSGTALLGLASVEKKAETQLVWFTRAEEELRQALQAAPDDWDAKFNYEIAARVLAEMRRQPKKKADMPIQLLRPQPAQGPAQRKVG